MECEISDVKDNMTLESRNSISTKSLFDPIFGTLADSSRSRRFPFQGSGESVVLRGWVPKVGLM